MSGRIYPESGAMKGNGRWLERTGTSSSQTPLDTGQVSRYWTSIQGYRGNPEQEEEQNGNLRSASALQVRLFSGQPPNPSGGSFAQRALCALLLAISRMALAKADSPAWRWPRPIVTPLGGNARNAGGARRALHESARRGRDVNAALRCSASREGRRAATCA